MSYDAIYLFDSITLNNLSNFAGKVFDITYIRLKFHSLRPDSFAIYKKNRSYKPANPDPHPNKGWIPWQYYSSNCKDTYGLEPTKVAIKSSGFKNREDQALCNNGFSNITPLSGANVAFSTLEYRPSMYNFEYSPKLQEWVSATDIRIVLKRLNTFGDEVRNNDKVLKSYYYAISDLTVGGRYVCLLFYTFNR